LGACRARLVPVALTSWPPGGVGYAHPRLRTFLYPYNLAPDHLQGVGFAENGVFGAERRVLKWELRGEQATRQRGNQATGRRGGRQRGCGARGERRGGIAEGAEVAVGAERSLAGHRLGRFGGNRRRGRGGRREGGRESGRKQKRGFQGEFFGSMRWVGGRSDSVVVSASAETMLTPCLC